MYPVLGFQMLTVFVNLIDPQQSGRPRGCGILEFVSIELAQEAIRRMNNQDIRGKKISVQQLTDEERDKFGYVINNRNTAAAGSLTLSQTVCVK